MNKRDVFVYVCARARIHASLGSGLALIHSDTEAQGGPEPGVESLHGVKMQTLIESVISRQKSCMAMTNCLRKSHGWFQYIFKGAPFRVCAMVANRFPVLGHKFTL